MRQYLFLHGMFGVGMRSSRIFAIAVFIVMNSSATQADDDPAVAGTSLVDPQSLVEMLAETVLENPRVAGVLEYLPDIDPLAMFCFDYVELPWIMGLNDVVRKSPDSDLTYIIQLPLAGGSTTADTLGEENSQGGTNPDRDFNSRDALDYFAMTGIVVNHDGYGTSAYAQVVVGPETPLKTC